MKVRDRVKGSDDAQRTDIFTSPFTPNEPGFLAGARHNQRDGVIVLLDAHEVAMSEVKAHVTLSGAVLLTGSIPRRCYISILPLPNVGQRYHVSPVYSWTASFSPMRAKALGGHPPRRGSDHR